MSGPEWEVVVVGAGPAGSASAARLARLGHRVLLLDREAFPRPKPCGDCISPAGVHELELLGALGRVRAEKHHLLSGWRVVPGGTAGFRGAFPDGNAAMAIARERLDRVLLEHARDAGVEVWTGVRATDLLRDAAGAVRGVVTAPEGEVRASLVIGADGLRSMVVRRLGLVKRTPRLRKLALTARVSGWGEAEGLGELHVLPRMTIGLAPIGDGRANVTVVVGEEEAERVAGNREEYYDQAIRLLPRSKGARRAGDVLATGPFDWPVRSAVADGALLVGDAAGYYDPFTGQGIYRALRGAALAAESAHRALLAGDRTARGLRSYDRAQHAAFVPGARLQRVIEQFVSRQRVLNIASAALRRRPELADTLVAVTGDLLPVRTLWAPRTLSRIFA